MSYDTCFGCGKIAFKNNGEGKPICYNKAVFGKCEEPKIAKLNERKIGRNDKCPCGSGKKFKHCCLNE